MSPRPTDGATPDQPRLFAGNHFGGFGPSLFRPADEEVVGRRYRSRSVSHLRKQVRQHAPRCPGVYGMSDDHGRLIYIGKAKSLRARLLSYFRVRSRDPKAARIIRHTRALAWEQVADEFAALLRELELIQRLRPRFNVRGVPGLRRQHYLCLGKSPVPYVYVTTRPTGQELGVYGPLIHRRRSEEAARRLNDWFRLRDCPETVPLAFSDQRLLFEAERPARCIRFELGTCLGPCAGACSRQDYSAAVRRVKAFLDGRDDSLLVGLRNAMRAAANDFQFEKAAALRDRLTVLEWLDTRLRLIREARQPVSYVYPVSGHDGRERWYLIRAGLVVGVVLRPEAANLRAVVRELLEPGRERRSAVAPTVAPTVIDSVLLVAGWFRKYPGEAARLIAPEQLVEPCYHPRRDGP